MHFARHPKHVYIYMTKGTVLLLQGMTLIQHNTRHMLHHTVCWCSWLRSFYRDSRCRRPRLVPFKTWHFLRRPCILLVIKWWRCSGLCVQICVGVTVILSVQIQIFHFFTIRTYEWFTFPIATFPYSCERDWEL